MKDFSGKVVALSGAASGLGRALAVRLGAEGAALAIGDIDEPGLKETAGLVQGSPKLTTHVVDVSQREAVADYARSVVQEHGHVDAIINNAGVTASGSIAQMSYEDFEWVVDIDLWGVIHCVKAFLPLLMERPEAHVVNISSINAFVPFPENGPYNLSKYAVAGLSETLMQELIDTQVAVTCVHPGGIQTRILRNARNATAEDSDEFDRLAMTSPDRAARIVIRGMKRKKRRLFVGADARVMSWMKRLFPMATVRLFARLWAWRNPPGDIAQR